LGRFILYNNFSLHRRDQSPYRNWI